MSIGRKQISFDLNTSALKDYYLSKRWESAYDDIRRHMKANGFEWRQGSVYVSVKPVDKINVSQLLKLLVSKQSWLNICMRDCVVTNIGKEHSLNHLFDKTANVPEREKS
jgi:virulence-associated protein VapD